jgi:hypothetical protein
MVVCMVVRCMSSFLSTQVSNPSVFELKGGGRSVVLPPSYPTHHASNFSRCHYEDKQYNQLLRASCVSSQTKMPNLLRPELSPHMSSLPSIFSTLPLATSASASGNNFNFNFAQPQPRSTFRALSQHILGRLQTDFEKSCVTGTYLTLCDAAIRPPCLSFHIICRPVLTALTLTALIPFRPCAYLEHICAGTCTCSRHPFCRVPRVL